MGSERLGEEGKGVHRLVVCNHLNNFYLSRVSCGQTNEEMRSSLPYRPMQTQPRRIHWQRNYTSPYLEAATQIDIGSSSFFQQAQKE